MITVEYDRRVHEIAKGLLQSRPHVTLLNCDVLKNKNRFNPEVLEAVTTALDASPTGGAKSLKLVANLPYNVATPVMSNLVVTDLPWTRMVVTIQYELAERMAAAAERYRTNKVTPLAGTGTSSVKYEPIAMQPASK